MVSQSITFVRRRLPSHPSPRLAHHCLVTAAAPVQTQAPPAWIIAITFSLASLLSMPLTLQSIRQIIA